jgi:pimeloyl-ACP methyl ester carboxylesterase
MRKVLFLPGAGGSAQFWEPVARRLPDDWDKVLLGWPGLGDQPHDPAVRNIDDLVRLVEARIDGPVDLVAQSIGGVIAARIALARPQFVRRLVLVVTSAGLDLARFGASDWRDDYRRSFPNAADWVLQKSAAPQLPIEDISVPTLLIWGEVDPISPVAVGRYLEARMPDATLHVLADGDHELA